MTWDRMEEEWKQGRDKAIHHWGNMMNDELAGIAGEEKEVAGRSQARYGIAEEMATQHVRGFKETARQLTKSNSTLMGMHTASSRQKTADRKPVKPRTPARKRSRSRVM